MNANSRSALISIVVPLYNEEEVLETFYDALIQVLRGINKHYEIIFVNDGSNDATEMIVTEIVAKDPCARFISFSRNFGHQIALTAGISHAKGDAIITMDGDLQHPPELIPKMISLWENGFDIVNTKRKKTRGINFIKKITSWGYYFTINKLSRTKIDPGSADFRLIDRKITNIFNQLKEKHRFLRGLVNWVGFKGTEIEYIADKRKAGKTKFSFSRMLNFADKGITSFSTAPLIFSFIIGIIIEFFTFLYVIYVLYSYFYLKQTIPDWTYLILIIFIINGVLMIFIGLLGRYIALIYDEVRDRPLYIVVRKEGFHDDET